jgi:predicted metalloprotease
MLWKGRRQSSNIEDRRGAGGGMGGMGGGMRFPGGLGGMGGGGSRMRGGGLGIGGIIILFIIAWILGINPLTLLSGGGLDTGGYSGNAVEEQTAGGSSLSSPQQEEMKEFVAVVLADTEDTWRQLLPAVGADYREPKLVLFSGGAQSGCGFAQSAVGPFYCPADEKVYLDLEFFDELAQRFGAPGDFAQAYVIAHEVGHHVQNVLGIEEQVRQARQGMSETESNAVSVRVELQADCFSGVWANHAHQERGLIEAGDIQEALGAASAVGDDTLQKRSSGRVVPDSFTHGSAEQRVRWFETGYRSGKIEACDTFSAKSL